MSRSSSGMAESVSLLNGRMIRSALQMSVALTVAVVGLVLGGCGWGKPVFDHQLVLEVRQETPGSPEEWAATMSHVRHTLELRLDAFGAARYRVRPDAAPNRLVVETSALSPPQLERLERLLTTPARLSICLAHPTATPNASQEKIIEEFDGRLPDGFVLVPVGKPALSVPNVETEYIPGPHEPVVIRREKMGEAAVATPETTADAEYILVSAVPIITGRDITEAYPIKDYFGNPAIALTFNEAGGERMGRATEANIGRIAAIVLDDRCLSAPVIQSRIAREAQITGQFSQGEAEILAMALKTNALPAGVRVVKSEKRDAP